MSATFSFAALSSSYTGSGFHSRRMMAYGCGCLALAQQGILLQLFNAGDMWTAGLAPGTAMLVGVRLWGTRSGGSSGSGSSGSSGPPAPSSYQFQQTFGNTPFNNLYSLFEFTDGSNTLYGWIQLSYTVSAQFGPDAIFGPELTIHDFAYDDSGALIAAGQTVDASQVPEPSTAVSTGLAALALGAVGLRQWRKTRQAA